MKSNHGEFREGGPYSECCESLYDSLANFLGDLSGKEGVKGGNALFDTICGLERLLVHLDANDSWFAVLKNGADKHGVGSPEADQGIEETHMVKRTAQEALDRAYEVLKDMEERFLGDE